MNEATVHLVEMATVNVGLGGQGVLPGGFILTAAHCIQWSGEGGMALGDVYMEPVVTRDGARFSLGLAACDPIADIAALSELDNQECGDDCDAFEAWRERVVPVPLSDQTLQIGESCAVFILTHKGAWLTGTVTRYGMPGSLPGSRFALKAKGIECGTSGGPVVTEDGSLLGVVSWFGSSNTGAVPIAHLALPRWVLDQIQRGATITSVTEAYNTN